MARLFDFNIRFMKIMGYPETDYPLSIEEKMEIIKIWGTPLYDAMDVWMPLYDEAKKLTKSHLRLDLAYFPFYPNMKFESSCGVVYITIHAGKDVSDKKRLGNPSVVVYYLENELCRTGIKKKTSSPSWEYKYQFFVHDINSLLQFNVVDENRDFGKCALNIADSLKKDIWYSLHNGAKLKLSIKFIPLDISQSLTDSSVLPYNDPLGVLKIFLVEAKGLQNVEIIVCSTKL
jgi:Ca2+-dependent lipid-binding protein